MRVRSKYLRPLKKREKTKRKKNKTKKKKKKRRKKKQKTGKGQKQNTQQMPQTVLGAADGSASGANREFAIGNPPYATPKWACDNCTLPLVPPSRKFAARSRVARATESISDDCIPFLAFRIGVTTNAPMFWPQFARRKFRVRSIAV